MREQRRTDRREGDGAAVAEEQLHVQVPFEGLDLL